MNKILLFAALIGLGMVSCKKDYTCECKTTSTFPGYTGGTASGSTGKMKKKDAEDKCNTGDATTTSSYIDPNTGEIESYNITTACEIK